MDRIAKAGLRYTQFHSTALCSPTRAALITGRNHHSVGFGVIGEMSTGYPGYDSVIGQDNATVGEILRENGYATSWFGKNHNTPSYQYSVGRPVRPVAGRMGFEYFYGFMGGETDQWTPYLFRDHTQIFPWVGKPGLQPHHRHGGRGDQVHERAERRRARQAVLRLLRARRHARAAPAERRSGSRNSKASSTWAGKSCARQIFANQKRLGVIPADTPADAMAGQPAEVGHALRRREEDLMPARRKSSPRYVAYTDHEIGRVIQAVEDMGKLDNTLIIYISGDNGTSAEGTLDGTLNQLTAYNGIEHSRRRADASSTTRGAPTRPTRTCRWLVVGVRHAVQVDQADRVALRRHSAGHGDVVARPHQGRRAASARSSTT